VPGWRCETMRLQGWCTKVAETVADMCSSLRNNVAERDEQVC
jgi:hypothetical protein